MNWDHWRVQIPLVTQILPWLYVLAANFPGIEANNVKNQKKTIML